MAEFTGRRKGKLSPQSREKMRAEQQFIDTRRPELDRDAAAHKTERLVIIEAFQTLKHQREQRGLSLSDVAQRSGIDKSYLSKLENDPYPNPTMATLMRIAGALGVKLTIQINDAA